MANSRDQMQDVFPVSFKFVKGEQPTATKLTGWVKQTDAAFSRMTRAIGDPWEYSSHSGTSGLYELSPERLAQASIARFSGPSDYVSPRGASFQESISTPILFHLGAHTGMWNVGFPLVKLSADTLPEDVGTSKISKLVWGVDITIYSDPGGLFTTEVASPDLVQSAGDFHIDYYSGSIYIYGKSNYMTILKIDNLHMLGPGVPWGTSNIIPHWDDSVSLCWVTENSSFGGNTTYNIALPSVANKSRGTTSSPSMIGAVTHLDYASTSPFVGIGVQTSGKTAKYRLPLSLTSNLSAGDSIPEGFMYVWDEDTGRIVPQTEFKYVDEYNVEVTTPEGWLTVGGSVRLIVTGSSLAEAVHYLMNVQRETRHVGLSFGQHQDTLHYTVPLSHNDLVETYSGYIASGTTDPHKYYFRKSDYPTNPHPQYIHRAGYMEDDADGNTGNAMRGNLAFAGVYDSSSSEFPVGSGVSGGNMTSTYGVMFGGGTIDSLSENARISWEGGKDLDSWTTSSQPAVRLGFGLDYLGAQNVEEERFGALTYTPWYGMPFYLRGQRETSFAQGRGAVLGFDLAQHNEMNYIKLVQAYRSTAYDVSHQAVKKDQTLSSVLGITPSLTSGSYNRLAAEQIREFRFRGGSYNENILNANDGLGGVLATQTDFDIEISHPVISVVSFSNYYVIPGEYSNDFREGDNIVADGFSHGSNNGTKEISSVRISGGNTHVHVSSVLTGETPSGATITVDVNEFNSYFTSPGMVGADFFNVYSNAIFFSDTGDGKATSFTTSAKTWLDHGLAGTEPTGIYFYPDTPTGKSYYTFTLYDSILSLSTSPLKIGDRYGLSYSSTSGNVTVSTNGGIVIASQTTIPSPTAGDINLISSDDVYISAVDNINISATDDVNISAVDNINISATDDVNISATEDMDLFADSKIHIRTNSSPSTTPNNGGIMLTADGAVTASGVSGIDMFAGYTPYSSNNHSEIHLNSSSIVLQVKDNTYTTTSIIELDDGIKLNSYDDGIYLSATGYDIVLYSNGGNIKSTTIRSNIVSSNIKAVYIDSNGNLGVQS